MLNFRVGIPFDDFLDLKSSLAELLRNLVRTKKEEIDVHLVPPPFVQVNRLVANVKGNEQAAARSQHSEKFRKGLRQIAARNVDDRVKRGDARPTFVSGIERQHVTVSKLDCRSQATRLLDHCRGKVNAANADASLVQVARNVPRSAPHVTGRPDVAHALGESVEQLAIQRLMLQFVEDPPHVLVRDAIVTCLVASAERSAVAIEWGSQELEPVSRRSQTARTVATGADKDGSD
jgi:hypothetical protein